MKIEYKEIKACILKLKKIKDIKNSLKSKNKTYFDHAALTPLCKKSQVEINKYYSSSYYPINKSYYREAQNATNFFFESRERIAALFCILSDDLFFFSSSSFIFYFLINSLKKIIKKEESFFIMEDSHNALIHPLINANSQYPFSIIFGSSFLLNEETCINSHIINQLKKNSSIRYCILPAVSHNLGYKIDIDKILEYSLANNIELIIDGTQAIATYNECISKNLFAYFFSSYKVYGPEGIAACFLNKKAQEIINKNSDLINRDKNKPFSYLMGSIPGSLVCGFQEALEWKYEMLKNYHQTIIDNFLIIKSNILKEYSVEKDFHSFLFNENNCSNHIFSIFHSTIHANDIAEELARNNICVRSGFLCADYFHQKTDTRALIRFSLGFSNLM